MSFFQYWNTFQWQRWVLLEISAVCGLSEIDVESPEVFHGENVTFKSLCRNGCIANKGSFPFKLNNLLLMTWIILPDVLQKCQWHVAILLSFVYWCDSFQNLYTFNSIHWLLFLAQFVGSIFRTFFLFFRAVFTCTLKSCELGTNVFYIMFSFLSWNMSKSS